MISTDGGIAAQLIPLDASLFNCFDPIDEDGSEIVSVSGGAEKAEGTIFDLTGYGKVIFTEPAPNKKIKTAEKPTAKKTALEAAEPLGEYKNASPQQRIELLARPYELSRFDKSPRPQWTPPQAVNDNQKRKHSFSAFDEARNNTLMVGCDRAATLIQNEWAFDILLEVNDLIEAATPKTAWLLHDGHGETDEHSIEDNANSGYGADVKHDYGPSVRKVKRLWEHCNDDEPSKKGKPSNASTPSKDGDPWKLGAVQLMDVVSEPSNKIVRALRHVGGLQMNECNNVTHFRDKKGEYLKFKTKTRGAKGSSSKPKADPINAHEYGAALPRNRKTGELAVCFFGGRTGSSNSAMPSALHLESEAGPTHSADDPWAAQIAADHARDDATIKLAQWQLLVGDQPYQALTEAASGFRIGELCGGRLGNTTDSARGRNLLQVAIERIIEERRRTLVRSKKAG